MAILFFYILGAVLLVIAALNIVVSNTTAVINGAVGLGAIYVGWRRTREGRQGRGESSS